MALSGQVAEARQYYTAAMERVSPLPLPRALYNLGLLEVRDGNSATGQGYLRRAVEYSDEPAIVAHAGVCLCVVASCLRLCSILYFCGVSVSAVRGYGHDVGCVSAAFQRCHWHKI